MNNCHFKFQNSRGKVKVIGIQSEGFSSSDHSRLSQFYVFVELRIDVHLY